ncbi:molecular chaperone DnaJ [Nevskia soli]|uniref:molecular chaperone DnaJ n=1 Tax=Nevskia soli TaxID=418856 RepID=UPI0015D8BA3D|nr:molecular chaperone DnaJ [Nevskia soli]
MTVSKRDYYEVLGVDRGADDTTIKAAYRKLALQYHPDRNPGDHRAEESFKEAAEAYAILSDGQKRAAYDRLGHQAVTGAAGPGFDPNSFDIGDLLSQFGFGDLFGGRGASTGGASSGRRRAQRGEDVRYDLEVSFEDAAFGMSADIQVPRLEACARCEGKGAEPGSGPVTCPACQGRGEQTYQQGFFAVRRTCAQCGGAGQIIRNPCRECRGEGYVRATRKLRVTIPPGVADGNRLCLRGEGQPGLNGGPSGDLYVFLKVQEHAFFERDGNDLHCVVPINFAQAALGADLQVPTLGGEPHTLRIPEGTQTGAQFRVRHKGVAGVNSNARGDLIVHVEVKTPGKLTREQRRIFEDLRETLPVDNQPHEKGLFEKVKDIFS